jgi:hypothetical protein
MLRFELRHPRERAAPFLRKPYAGLSFGVNLKSTLTEELWRSAPEPNPFANSRKDGPPGNYLEDGVQNTQGDPGMTKVNSCGKDPYPILIC